MKLIILFLLITTSIFGQITTRIENGTYWVSNTNIYFYASDVIINGTFNVNDTINFRNGNYTVDGSFISNNSAFRFYNDTTHDHNIWATSPCNFYDFWVGGNPSNIYDLHLNTNIGVSNHLTVNSEKLNVNNFLIELGSTGHIYNEGDGQYINDENGNSSYGAVQGNNPNIGTNTTTNPGNIGIEITTHGNAMGHTVIKRYHRQVDIGGGIMSFSRVFDVTPTYNGSNYGGNLNVDLKIPFFTDILNGIDPSTLKVYRSGDGGVTWENKGGTVDLVNGWVIVTGFNQFSQVTLAPDNNTPLPVELLYFNGHEYSTFNLLKWSTASEHNSDYFEIERSIDGGDWKVIGNKLASGNSNQVVNYSWLDSFDDLVIHYYRLKQVDYDGQFKLYGPIALDNTKSIKKIVKYINTLGQEVNPDTKGIIFEVYEDGTMRKIIR